jgi:DNA end-binding protein Ku
VIDLMEALRASLSANKTKRAVPAKTVAKTAAAKKASPDDVEALSAKPRRPVKRAAPRADVKEAPPAKVRARK